MTKLFTSFNHECYIPPQRSFIFSKRPFVLLHVFLRHIMKRYLANIKKKKRVFVQKNESAHKKLFQTETTYDKSHSLGDRKIFSIGNSNIYLYSQKKVRIYSTNAF